MAKIEKIAVPIIHLLPRIPALKERLTMQKLPIFAIVAAKKELCALGAACMMSAISKCEEISALEKSQTREGVVAAIGCNLFDRLDFHFLFLYKTIRAIDYFPNGLGKFEYLEEIIREFQHRYWKEENS